MRYYLILIYTLFAPTFALASTRELAELERLFVNRFESHYEARFCGKNIMGLMDAAKNAGIDISRARMLKLTNAGFTVFGLLNAEYARQDGTRRPDERNWEFHVVLELDCQVFDFDFGNEPWVLPMREYLDRMFLAEDPNPPVKYFYVGREKKLAEYRVESYRAATYFSSPHKPPVDQTLRLGELLKQCD